MGYFKRLWEQLPEGERRRALRSGGPGCGSGHCRCGGKYVRGKWYPCNMTPAVKGARTRASQSQNKRRN